MKGLETGKEKIQKICDSLRKETLEPAKQEAREIIENAHLQAAEIINDAKKKAAEALREQEKEGEERQRVFQASLNLACRQGIEFLKQQIERELFNKELSQLVGKEMGDPKVVADLLSSFMRSMEAKGIDEDFAAIIPKEVSSRKVSELLASSALAHLKNKPIQIGDFAGGLQIQLKGRQITIDITDAAVRELLAQYIRRDFRDLVFGI